MFGVLVGLRMFCAVRDGAADHGGLLTPAEVARHDLATAGAAEALDQRPNVVRRQHCLVVVDGHGLGNGVRLRIADSGLPAQESLETRGTAAPQQTSRFKDSAGHGWLRSSCLDIIVGPLRHCRRRC